MKPLDAVELAIPRQDGSGSYDLTVQLAIREFNGKRVARFNMKTEWAARAEIWLNTYYRVTKDTVPAKSRFQAPLDTFVAGYGQRFDWRRAPVRGVRLTATLADGKPLELTKRFDAATGLAGALGGKR